MKNRGHVFQSVVVLGVMVVVLLYFLVASRTPGGGARLPSRILGRDFSVKQEKGGVRIKCGSFSLGMNPQRVQGIKNSGDRLSLVTVDSESILFEKADPPKEETGWLLVDSMQEVRYRIAVETPNTFLGEVYVVKPGILIQYGGKSRSGFDQFLRAVINK